MSLNKDDLPNISIVTILHDNSEFLPLLKDNWENIDYPKEKLELIIVDDSKEDYSNEFFILGHNLAIKDDISPEEDIKFWSMYLGSGKSALRRCDLARSM